MCKKNRLCTGSDSVVLTRGLSWGLLEELDELDTLESLLLEWVGVELVGVGVSE